MAISLFLAVSLLLSAAFSEEKECIKPQLGKFKIEVIPRLNLTSEQTAKLDELEITHAKKMKPVMDGIFSKRGDLMLLWLDQNPNAAKILAVQKEISSLEEKIQECEIMYRLSILEVLTSQQRDNLKIYRYPLGFSFTPSHGGDSPSSFSHVEFGPAQFHDYPDWLEHPCFLLF